MNLNHSLPMKDAIDGSATSIKSCLDYLYRVAISENYLLTAHLIGAAAESLSGHLESNGRSNGANGRYRHEVGHETRAK